MSYQGYLEEMLRPLGVYDMTGVFQQGELVACGGQLDGVADTLDELERELSLVTALDWGIEEMASLFSLRPTYLTEVEHREALMALLRIGGDSFTVEALNQVLLGCGTLAHVAETDKVGVVEISFPNIPGMPEGFENICSILEEILPSHLAVEYYFWYVTWVELEKKIPTFGALDGRNITWAELESLVY